jgi:DNA polymerase I-like protein with 3'-5' exonuclease and polymerase domains
MSTESPAGARRGGSIFRRLAAPYIVSTISPPSARPRYAFDTESNGFLDIATVIHCIVIVDLDSDEVFEFGPELITAGLEQLSRAAYLVGHNIGAHDFPLMHKLHGWAPPAGCTIVDTMITSRTILPHIAELDDTAAAMGDAKLGTLRGRHSIEAWGLRLGMPKVGVDITDWSVWTPAMQERCVADTKITKRLWQFLNPDAYSQRALELEHRTAAVCNRIAADGAPFDLEAADRLRQKWVARLAELEAPLLQQFPGTNLSSRIQIAKLLEARGYVFEEFTPKSGQPKITDELLEAIPALYPEFAGLSEYYTLGRRIAQLSTGSKAWCKNVGADGRIHGGIIHIGTPHSRAAHLEPNLAQVPNPKKGKPFATECRSLFRTKNDWVFVCCDQAGLQDRAFAHYLSEYDGGAYAKAFLDGLDPHWKTARDLGLIAPEIERDKQNKVHAVIRENSKSFRYAFLFGAGQARAGHIINNTTRAVAQIDPSNGLHQQFFGDRARPNEDALKRVGKQALEKFMGGTPGLKKLRARLSAQVEQRSWLPALDGRRVPVGAQYKALNYQVTSAEAVITKRWLCNVFDELNARFRYGWNGDVVIALWVHDEIACVCKPEIAAEVSEILVRHAKEPAEFYGFKVPLDADCKVSRSWAGEPSESTGADHISASNPRPALPAAIAAPPWEESPESIALTAKGAGGFAAAAAQLLNGNNGAGSTVLPEPTAPAPGSTRAASGLMDAINSVREFIAAAESGPNPDLPEQPRGNGHDRGDSTAGGNNGHQSDYRNDSHRDRGDESTDKPYGPIRSRLLARGYQVTRTFPFTVPGEAVPLFYEDRYELKSGFAPSEERPRKTSRYWRRENGKELNGTGARRIIFNWPAIMQAGPESTVFITEGANKSEPLNRSGLIATAAPYHQWGPECASGLAGRHLIYHEDHDLPDENGKIKAKEFSADACKKLSPGAASFRIVPARHLWKNLAREGEPPHGWDVKDWLEGGGDPAKLLEICREIAADSSIKVLSKEEFLSGFVPPDYLIDGMLQRRFIYSLTGQTGHAKTSIALRIAQLVDCGGFIDRHEVSRGRVAYLVGENPDDVRMRVIGDDAVLEDEETSSSNILFVPGTFDTDALLKQIEALGELDLVIIDTSAAYFLGDDENSNAELGEHARKLRRLIRLPGGPCVLVLCHPIKHAAEQSQLLPRGGGSFLAEMDGNLTAWKVDKLVTLSHSDKFRGPGFEPITFRLDKTSTEKLKDRKGRTIPTVRAVAISEDEERQEMEATRRDDDLVMMARDTNGDQDMSIADLARALEWFFADGRPAKSRVQRALSRLKAEGLMKQSRGKWDLTDKGRKAIRKSAKKGD